MSLQFRHLLRVLHVLCFATPLPTTVAHGRVIQQRVELRTKRHATFCAAVYAIHHAPSDKELSDEEKVGKPTHNGTRTKTPRNSKEHTQELGRWQPKESHTAGTTTNKPATRKLNCWRHCRARPPLVVLPTAQRMLQVLRAQNAVGTWHSCSKTSVDNTCMGRARTPGGYMVQGHHSSSCWEKTFLLLLRSVPLSSQLSQPPPLLFKTTGLE